MSNFIQSFGLANNKDLQGRQPISVASVSMNGIQCTRMSLSWKYLVLCFWRFMCLTDRANFSRMEILCFSARWTDIFNSFYSQSRQPCLSYTLLWTILRREPWRVHVGGIDSTTWLYISHPCDVSRQERKDSLWWREPLVYEGGRTVYGAYIPPAQSEYLKYLKAIIMAQLLCRNIVISHKQQYNKHK